MFIHAFTTGYTGECKKSVKGCIPRREIRGQNYLGGEMIAFRLSVDFNARILQQFVDD